MVGGIVPFSTGSEMKLTSVRRTLMSGAAFAGVVLVVGMLALPAGAASPKANVRPLTCTDNWKTATSGQWTAPGSWSTGVVPTSTDHVCITLAGTYSVTITGSASAGTIKLGGSSGTQTLKIKGSPAANSTLTLSDATGSQIAKHGVLKMQSKNTAGSGFSDLQGPSATL